MIKIDSRTGRMVLMVARGAGTVDMVALPVWVGKSVGYGGLGLAAVGVDAAALFMFWRMHAGAAGRAQPQWA